MACQLEDLRSKPREGRVEQEMPDLSNANKRTNVHARVSSELQGDQKNCADFLYAHWRAPGSQNARIIILRPFPYFFGGGKNPGWGMFSVCPLVLQNLCYASCFFLRKALDTFNFLRHVMRAIWSVRPKCSHASL